MFIWAGDVKLGGFDLFLDAAQPRPFSYVSHAHSDHLGAHARGLMTPATASLAKARVPCVESTAVEYNSAYPLSTDLIATLRPAGHVLGSSMIHLEGEGGSGIYTGDFKLRESLTCPPAELRPATHLLMECTYGLPRFRFPSRASLADWLLSSVNGALDAGKQPLAFAYALGKAQEVTRVLTDAGVPVTVHGAVARVHEIYESFGVRLGPWRRYKRDDFHGPAALDLRERGVLLAPPSNTRTTFTTRFDRRHTMMLSGWGLDPSARYRYGVDEVIPVSDHADYDELLETIDRVNPQRVYLQHGFVKEFTDDLRKRGLDARPIRPDDQLELF